MLNLYVQSYDTCFCICIGDLGLWPSFPENSHLLKGQLALASCSTAPVAPLLAAQVQWHHCPQQRLGLVHCLPPHICLCVLPFSYPCILLLLLLLHTCVTITLVLYYNLQNVTVVTTELYPFVENCSQALPRAQSFWWEIRVAACYWMVQEHAWCYKSTTCTILEKYYQVIQMVSTTTGSLSSKYHWW